jgi:hypothetical protein
VICRFLSFEIDASYERTRKERLQEIIEPERLI